MIAKSHDRNHHTADIRYPTTRDTMTTLKDISKALNLSVTTVSRALNGFPEVNEQTRELVMQAAREMNYQPNQFARKLVTGQSGMVGIVQQASPELSSNPCFIEVITGISQHLSTYNKHFILHVSTGSDVMTTYQQLVARRILDGFILTEPARHDPRIALLLDKDIPFVVHGRSPEREDYPYFDIDNYQVGCELTQHLLDLGHKRIAFINGPAQLGFASERYRGFTDVLAAHGLSANPALVHHGLMLESVGFQAAQTMLERSLTERPTAFICSNTLLVTGLMSALEQAGLSVPHDVSVVAHDDKITGWRRLPETLTATLSPLSDASQPLAEILVKRIAGEPLEALQRVVRAPLLIKGTSAPPAPTS